MASRRSDFVEHKFEFLLRAIQDRDMRQAVIDVADTMYVINLWFKERRLQPTAADLIAAAQLILQREDNIIGADDEASSG